MVTGSCSFVREAPTGWVQHFQLQLQAAYRVTGLHDVYFYCQASCQACR